MEADGEVRGYSPALSLYLCVDVENRLRFWDPAIQEYLPTHREAIEGQARSEAARERESALRINAEAELERERAARIEAEAEIERLRDRLRRSDSG